MQKVVWSDRRYKPICDERQRYQAMMNRKAELAAQRRQGVEA
jgi:hypothetical protein